MFIPKYNTVNSQRKSAVSHLGSKLPNIYSTKKDSTTNLNKEELYGLIEACLHKNREGQKKLYTVFFEYASEICLRYASSDEDTIEILNDGFLKIFTELRKFECKHDNPVAAFKAWLKQIMVYTAIDHFRKNKKHLQNTSLSEAVLMIPSIEETNLDKLSYKEIIACVQKLPPSYRTVFSLYVLDGFTHNEISEQLGIATGTSKSNLAKAKMHLQKMLGELSKNEKYEQTAV